MIGKIVDGKYKLGRLLGEGGMGSVYEAENVSTQERVAVKVINSRLVRRGGDGVSRFRREARAAGAIDSEHIVQVLDSGTDEASRLLYLVMEYLDGDDLQRLIDRIGPLAPYTALRIAAQALVGLQKAHEAHIVHRDIKPANLFLARCEGGAIKVKLLDFGIAKIIADPLSFPHTTGLTNTGGFLGSPRYMAPEQVQNSRDVHPQTDIWSLGSALYCALTGHAPYGHLTSIGDLIFAICRSAPPLVQDAAPWVSREVSEVVRGALSLKLEERYPSAAAMLAAMPASIHSDMALREDMLVPLSPEQRAERPPSVSSGPPPASGKVVIHLETTKPILGDEITHPADPTALSPTALSPTALSPTALPPTPLPPTALAPSEPAAPRSTPAPLDTTTRGHETVPLPPESEPAREAPRRNVRSMVVAGVVLVAGLVAVWMLVGRAGPPELPANTAEALAPRPPSPPESAGSSAAATSDPIKRVRLVIVPSDVSVEVDGVRTPVSNGIVEVAGALGSSHRVRVFNAKSETVAEVFVTDQGALPDKVELRPPVRPEPGRTDPSAKGAKPAVP